MLTLPDFREKHLVSVSAEYGHDHLLQLVNDNLRFLKDGQVVNQISLHLIFALFVVGDLSVTTSLLKKLTAHGISVFFLNQNLSYKAGIVAEAEGNYLLRQKQYSSLNELFIAKKIVENKIDSQESLLNKFKKECDRKIFLKARRTLEKAKDREQLLGIEGLVGKTYFQSLFGDLGWVRRAPQTKEDIINLLLDIGYTYLFNYCDCLLRLFGFDTYKGNYHQLFFQRKSLTCDIMEPLRPVIDQQIVKSFHLKQIKEKDFVFRNARFDFKNGFKTYRLYNGIFLEAINNRKENIYTYILNFYHYCMDDKKYQFPMFSL